MTSRFIHCCVAFLVLIAYPASLLGIQNDGEANAKKAIAQVNDFLRNKKSFAQPKKKVIADKVVTKLFPDWTFVAARYQQWPVAVQPPKGLKSSNLFAVNAKGGVDYLPDAMALKGFFQKNFRHEAVSKTLAERCATAWLLLAQELAQDGYYEFEITKETEQAGTADSVQTVGKRAIVSRGGNGEIRVTVQFKDGKINRIDGKTKLRPGPRPRCQATKLLDDDPIVRYMAESELLFLGQMARPYLLEQRAKANPPLRAAIDRLLKKIAADGW